MNTNKTTLTILLRKAALLPVYFYRACISPLTPPSCRFTPPARNTWWRRCRNTASSRAVGWASSAFAGAIHGAARVTTPFLNSRIVRNVFAL